MRSSTVDPLGQASENQSKCVEKSLEFTAKPLTLVGVGVNKDQYIELSGKAMARLGKQPQSGLPSRRFLLLLDLGPPLTLSRSDLPASRGRHRSFGLRNWNDLLSLNLRPASSLSSGNTSAAFG